MELKQYLNIVLKRLWIIILLPVITGSISAYVSFYVMEPVYEASTTLYIINKNVDNQVGVSQADLTLGQTLISDYRELMKSKTVTSEVIKQLDLKGMSPGRLAGSVSVNAKNNTRVVEVRVKDNDPKRAALIADKISEVFMVKAVEWMKVDNVSIVDRAQVPGAPVMPQPYRNISIAVLFGIVAAVGIILLIEYLDDTIKTNEDVEKYLGLPVIGTIPVLSIK